MAVSVQVIYPVVEGTTFDYDHYRSRHMDLVNETMGPHLDSMVVTKGVSAPDGSAPAYFAVATFLFADEEAMKKGMAETGPLREDLANFTNTTPQFLIGEVIA